jgi:hypothetical protein
MTTAIAVAAVLGSSFALASLIRQVDGATLRRWRLYRRWDVSRLAREFIAAADEPLATLRGLMHMINAWERGARRPSERYWLLYLRVFPECASGEPAIGGPEEAGALAAELPCTAEINAMDAADFSPAPSVDPGDISSLAATVKALEQQIAGLSRRLDELSRSEHVELSRSEHVELSRSEQGERQPREKQPREKRKTRPRYRRSSWVPLWTALVPSLVP